MDRFRGMRVACGGMHTSPQQWARPAPPPRRRSRIKVIVLSILGVLATIIVLAAVTNPADRNKPVASASPSASASRFASGIPTPDAQQTEDLLYGLRRIHPDLDRARSISRARNICDDLLKGIERDQVVDRARRRFEGGGVTLSRADGAAIVELVESGGWCR